MASVPRIAQDDPDDDHVIACVSARADLIVSGDKHLHSMGSNHHGIRIVKAADAVKILQES
jgi:predicted nucleic acid-binding protein